jgi:NADPH2:quinone reductase
MKSVRFHRTGGPDELKCEEMAVPSPVEGEVLVRVELAGVNYADLMRRRGEPYPIPTPLPFNPGGEIVGVVAQCGRGVDPGLESRRVLTALPDGGGGYAQYATAPAAMLIPLPDGLAGEHALALHVQGLTAGLALKAAGRLAPGETVFIEAATGGVGSIAVQLAKLFGAGQVIAGVGGGGKRAAALELGADAAIDYSEPDWPRHVLDLTGGRGVDLLLDMTCGALLSQGLGAVAPFGRAVIYGSADPVRHAPDLPAIVANGQSLIGFVLKLYFEERPSVAEAMMKDLIGYVLEGRLVPRIGGILPLEDAGRAHEILESRASYGKIVLRAWP